MVEITSARVRLRPFGSDDLTTFAAYRCDPEVARYQSWDSTYSMTDAHRFFESQTSLVFGLPGDWFQLAIVDRKVGTLCGDCAVRVTADQPETAEVGITLARTSQGRGLATEALIALLTGLFVEADWFKGEWSTLRIYAMLNREWRDPRRG